jgi:hypothetical protein
MGILAPVWDIAPAVFLKAIMNQDLPPVQGLVFILFMKN